MANVALSVTVVLESTSCGNCGIHFAIPTNMLSDAKATGRGFFCPNGHGPLAFNDNEAVRLKRELDKERLLSSTLRQEAIGEKHRREHAEKMREITEKKLKRTERRARAGVCLDCHRTFKDVERHRATKHGSDGERTAAGHAEKKAAS